jgi:hypothetical protein
MDFKGIVKILKNKILLSSILSVISVIFLISPLYASSFSQYTVSSQGSIALPKDQFKQSDRAVFGWGGYITTVGEVIPILDDLKEGGYNAIRYWARPYWLYGRSSHNLNFEVLDHLVEEAAKRNIVVYIDCEHNYPPSPYINASNREVWINEVIQVGLRYKDKSNVVLEPINEYTGSDQVELYNWAIARIRAAGIHLPLLWNFWWNQRTVALNDPDNNYAVGRHIYGRAYDNYNPPTPMALQQAVQDSGIAKSMYRYFEDPSQTLYLQEVIRLKIPNGWVISELGPTDNEELVDNPSVGNMAFAMQFLREALSHNVSVICYRIGSFSKKALYEQKAHEYFKEDFFPAK